jgi:hypothetical protein
LGEQAGMGYPNVHLGVIQVEDLEDNLTITGLKTLILHLLNYHEGIENIVKYIKRFGLDKKLSGNL